MITRRIIGLQFAAGVLLLWQGLAHAQQPLGIKVGPGWRLYPELEMRGIYDNNFFFFTDDEIDAFGLLLRPAVSAVREGRRSKLETGVRAELARYDTSSDDDYVDSDFFARFNYVLTKRNRFNVGAERQYGHDPFGLRRTELADNVSPLDIDRTLDEYHNDQLSAGYGFGTPGARINLDYDFNYRIKQYDTNRDLGTRFLDFDLTSHQGTLTYNYSPKTALLARAQYREIDYDNTRPSRVTRDFQEVRYLAGFSWRPSGKVSLQALGGVIQHDPDSPQREDFSEPDWDIGASWQPTARTTLTLNTGREVRPSFFQDSDFINVKQYTVGWRQVWTARLSSQLTYLDASQDFEGRSRNDELRRADLEASLLVARDFALVASVAYLEASSNLFGRDFEKELFTLGFRYQP